MEVHHHSHTPSSQGKKWTHYFWEFLMLFLAVFCGFLAEYQLEHVIEHQRAKVYATNLYEDLKKDTAELNRVIHSIESDTRKLDTLSSLIEEKGTGPAVTRDLYYYAGFSTHVTNFSSVNATMEELKGSGNIRLMNSKVAMQISKYDSKLRKLYEEYNLSRAELIKMEELHFKIFDGQIAEKLSTDPHSIGTTPALGNTLKLNNDDPRLITEYMGWVTFEKNIYRMQIRQHLVPLKEEAENLIMVLKNEYHLE